MKFNKMFVMLPVMFAARKLNAEDPAVVYWVRVAYVVVQCLCVALVAYTYLQATFLAADKNKSSGIIYVAPPPPPFADPDAKKKYTEITFGAHVLAQARSLLGSTLFGIAMTLGLHWYKGMLVGMAIQAIMGPLNLLENALIKALFISGKGLNPQDRIFEEKVASELTADDEVVDGKGEPVVAKGGAAAIEGSGAKGAADKTLEHVLLDTWDSGAKADLSEILEVLNAGNCNYQTAEDEWTALMILSGLGGGSGKTTAVAAESAKAIAVVVDEYRADPTVVDKEGWTAMHWAAFHGSAEAAKALVKLCAASKRGDGKKLDIVKLLATKDKEGHTPIDMARKEHNDEVANIYEKALGETKKSK